MVRSPPTYVFEVKQPKAFIDPNDASKGQVTFLTDLAWYHFRLSRTELQKLAREIEQALRASTPEPHKG